MRPQLLAETIRAHHAQTLAGNHRTLFIEGEPGLGKSSIPRQVARQDSLGFIQFNVPLRLQEDYGMPVIAEDRQSIDFVVSEKMFPLVGSDHFPEQGYLVADELSGGGNPEQKVWAGLVQDREIHGRHLKPGWSIVATGNRTKDRAGANRILSMLANRMNRVTLEPHLDDWCSWALDNGVNPIVVAFARFRPGNLCNFDPQQDSNGTPRAWAEGVSPFIDNLPSEAEFEVFKGAVGEGNAAEFMGFLRMYRELPNPDAVLLDPEGAEVPTELSTLFAIAGAVAARATQVNFDRVMTYAKRLPPEFMVLMVRDAMRADRSVIQTKAFVAWTTKEGAGVLL